MDALKYQGNSVERENYNLVYTNHLYPADTLESIYARFHQDRQPDFDGPSLMVSDVIVMNREGVRSAYYVDNLGFRELKDFLPALENPAQRQRQAVKGKEKKKSVLQKLHSHQAKQKSKKQANRHQKSHTQKRGEQEL